MGTMEIWFVSLYLFMAPLAASTANPTTPANQHIPGSHRFRMGGNDADGILITLLLTRNADVVLTFIQYERRWRLHHPRTNPF
jgi:hypothetical protein